MGESARAGAWDRYWSYGHLHSFSQVADGNYAGAVADWLPHTPRQTLVALGLITSLGVLIQWTLFHKQADK